MLDLIAVSNKIEHLLLLSGRTDLNRRPLQPHCSALAKLGYAPPALKIIPQSMILTSRPASHLNVETSPMPHLLQRRIWGKWLVT